MDLIKISPEHITVANSYLTTGSITSTANELSIPPDRVAEILDKREVRSYVDQVFLDQGYRNRSKLADLLDRVIDSKVEEAEESGIYSNKDLAELIDMAHKHRMAELKHQKTEVPTTQVNAQVNNYGDTKYGELMKQLLECPKD